MAEQAKAGVEQQEPVQQTPQTTPETAPVETPTAAPQQQEWTGVRDFVKSTHNVDLSSFQDDSQAIQAMVQAYQQYPQYQKRIQELERLAAYGNEYLAQQRNQGPPQQTFSPGESRQTEKSWWTPPISQDEAQRLMSLYTDPETGNLKPTTPPSVHEKLTNYASYVADWNKKWTHNPDKALDEILGKKFDSLFASRMSQVREHDATANIIQQNANWMFYQNPQTGQPDYRQWTPAGQYFRNAVAQIERMGVRDPNAVNYLALTMLQNMSYQHQVQAMHHQQQAMTGKAPGVPGVPQAHKANYTTPQGNSVPEGTGGIRSMVRDALRAANIKDWDDLESN